MTALAELEPYQWASQARRFRVTVTNGSSLEARCIYAAAADPKRKTDPRPPAVQIITGPASMPIHTYDPNELRALIAVLEEAANWLDTATPADQQLELTPDRKSVV